MDLLVAFWYRYWSCIFYNFLIKIFRRHKSNDVGEFFVDDNVKNEDIPKEPKIPRVIRTRKISRRPSSDQLEAGEYSSETDPENADEDNRPSAEAEPLPDSNIENLSPSLCKRYAIL